MAGRPRPSANWPSDDIAPCWASIPVPEFLLLGTGPTLVRPPRALIVRAGECSRDSASRRWTAAPRPGPGRVTRRSCRWIAGALYPLGPPIALSPAQRSAPKRERDSACRTGAVRTPSTFAAAPPAIRPRNPDRRRTMRRTPPTGSAVPAAQDACTSDLSTTVVAANGKQQRREVQAPRAIPSSTVSTSHPDCLARSRRPTATWCPGPEERRWPAVPGGAVRLPMAACSRRSIAR